MRNVCYLFVTSEPFTVSVDKLWCFFINQYYQNSSELVQNPTKLQLPRSTTSAHKVASVALPLIHLTTTVCKRSSPFPKRALKALQRCPKNLKDCKQFLSPPTSFNHITRAWGQQALVRKRAGDKQKTPAGSQLPAGCFSPSQISSGFTFTFPFFPPHFCLLCKNASQRLLAELSHLWLQCRTRRFGSF